MFRSILIISALALSACTTVMEEEVAVETPAVEEAVAVQTTDVVSTAMSADNLSTFVSAVQAAGLTETMAGPGPFTVFAPTDAAFAALPEGTLDRLLAPENRERLRILLAYHVVPGRVTSTEFAGQQVGAQTAMGSPLQIDATGGGIRVDDANVIAADIDAANGIIHVVDRVLVPQVAPAS